MKTEELISELEEIAKSTSNKRLVDIANKLSQDFRIQSEVSTEAFYKLHKVKTRLQLIVKESKSGKEATIRGEIKQVVELIEERGKVKQLSLF